MRATERMTVTGSVQGVGFRPFVWRKAHALALAGQVRNRGDHVEVLATGTKAQRDSLMDALREGPPHAHVDSVTRAPDQRVFTGPFTIATSEAGALHSGIVPDLALCPACRADINTPGTRRWRYALTCCADCGPRFSIVTGFPYDRANTTMAPYTLCPACRAEYENPADRRFHAEPVACPACGPRLHYTGPATPGEDPLDSAASLLRSGGILAIKGTGGYHLACLATDTAAIATLRTRKHRPTKPLAVMVADTAAASAFAAPSAAELHLLHDAAAPIVTVRATAALPESLAPGLDRVGLILAYTPLHALLLAQIGQPLVMTSGNRSGAPQAIEDAEALHDLAGIADGWLYHDRRIARRLDDSVCAIVAGHTMTLRRGRGLAPRRLPLPAGFETLPPVLAMGGDLKAAFCLTQNGQALLSHHLGDLQAQGVEETARQALADYRTLFGLTPALVAVDAHPDYISHRLGAALSQQMALPLHTVWHHHAHIAACMAEHGLGPDTAPVIGLALDGTGLGPDGTAWGCEALLCDYRTAYHAGRLARVPMPGADRAAREPWRMLLAHLDTALGPHATGQAVSQGLLPALHNRPLDALRAMIRTGLNAPLCSSAGRLFDAMAALLDVAPERLTHEGEAAMRLETLARQAPPPPPEMPPPGTSSDPQPDSPPDNTPHHRLATAPDSAACPPVLHPSGTVSGPLLDRPPYSPLPDMALTLARAADGVWELNPAPLWAAALAAKARGVPACTIAAGFHAALAAGLASLVMVLVREHAPAGGNATGQTSSQISSRTGSKAGNQTSEQVSQQAFGPETQALASPATLPDCTLSNTAGGPQAPGFAQAPLRTVVLGGGVMANDLLVSALVTQLEAAGLRVLRPAFAPPGDGGLALGQAVIAAACARLETD
ncbi:MAG: carbamoyltransferase HypF [Acetobacter papayae]